MDFFGEDSLGTFTPSDVTTQDVTANYGAAPVPDAVLSYLDTGTATPVSGAPGSSNNSLWQTVMGLTGLGTTIVAATTTKNSQQKITSPIVKPAASSTSNLAIFAVVGLVAVLGVSLLRKR